MLKAIDNFNQQLSEKGSAVQLKQDLGLFSLRIGKKKNGKPNWDYPSKSKDLHTSTHPTKCVS
jgi:hypothetical protein